MSESEYKIFNNNSNKLIVCFGEWHYNLQEYFQLNF